MANIGNNLLLVFTIFVLVAGGLMALLIGLVLPDHFHHEVGSYSQSWSELQGRQFKPQSNIHPYIRERNKGRTYGRIWNFPWLVSISIPVHLDDSFAKYACTGTVISANKVLTGDDCIRAPLIEEDFRKCIVRSESEYFSEGGVVHQVVDYVSSKSAGLVPPYDALYILQVFPDFSKYVEIVELYLPKITWNTVIEAGWGGNKIAHVDILKHDPFYYEKWYRSKKNCCNNIDPCPYCGIVPTVACSLESVLQGNFKSSKINGRPLVIVNGSSPTILIGIQMNHEYDTDSTTFIDLRYEGFLKWARNSTSNQNGHKDPCTEKIKLYRMVHFYGCNEKNRDSYLYAFGLKGAIGRIINVQDCETPGHTVPSITEVRVGTDKQTTSRAEPTFRSPTGGSTYFSSRSTSVIEARQGSKNQTGNELSMCTDVIKSISEIGDFTRMEELTDTTIIKGSKTETSVAIVCGISSVHESSKRSLTISNIGIDTMTNVENKTSMSPRITSGIESRLGSGTAIIDPSSEIVDTTTMKDFKSTKLIKSIKTKTSVPLVDRTSSKHSLFDTFSGAEITSTHKAALATGNKTGKTIVSMSTYPSPEGISSGISALSIENQRSTESDFSTAVYIGTTVTNFSSKIEGFTVPKTTDVTERNAITEHGPSITTERHSGTNMHSRYQIDFGTEIYSRNDTDNEHIAEESIMKSSTKNIFDRTYFDTAHDLGIVTETEPTTTFTNGTESDVFTGNDFVEKNKSIFDTKLSVNQNVRTESTEDLSKTTSDAVIIPSKDISSSDGIEKTFLDGKSVSSAGTTPRTENKSSTSIETISETDISTAITFKTEMKTVSHYDAEKLTGLSNATEMRTENSSNMGFETSFVDGKTELKTETKLSTSTESSNKTEVSSAIVFITEMKTETYTDTGIVTGLTDETEMRTEIGYGTIFEKKIMSGKTDTVTKTKLASEITVGTTEDSESTTETKPSSSMEASTGTDVSSGTATGAYTGAYTGAEIFTGTTNMTRMRPKIGSTSRFETSSVSDKTNELAETSLVSHTTPEMIVETESSYETKSSASIEANTEIEFSSAISFIESYDSVSYTAREITLGTTGETETKSNTTGETSTETDMSTKTNIRNETNFDTDIIFKTEMKTGAHAEILSGLTNTTETRTEIGSSTWFETNFVSGRTDTVDETAIGIRISPETISEIIKAKYGCVSYTADEITVCTTEETASTPEARLSTGIQTSTENVNSNMGLKTEIETKAYTDSEIVTGLADVTKMWIEIGSSTGLEKKIVSRETDTVAEITLGIEFSTKTSSEITKESYDFLPYTAHEITMCSIEENDSTSNTKSSTSTETSTKTDVSRENLVTTEMKISDYTVSEIITDTADMLTETGSSTGIKTSFESDKTDTVIGTSHVVESSPTTISQITRGISSSVSFTAWQITEDTNSTGTNKSPTSIEASIETVIRTEMKTGPDTDSEEFTELSDTTETRSDIDSGSVFKTSFVSNITDAVVLETSIGIDSCTRTSSEITGEPYSFISYTAQDIPVRTTEENESIKTIEKRTETDVSTEMVFKTDIETRANANAELVTGLTGIWIETGSITGLKKSFMSKETDTSMEVRTEINVSTDMVFKTDIETGAYADAELVTGLTDATIKLTEIGSGTWFKTIFMSDETDTVAETDRGIAITVGTTEESESSTEAESSRNMEGSTETSVSTETVFKTDLKTGAYTDSEIVSRLTDVAEMRSEVAFSTGLETKFLSGKTHTVAETTFGVGSNTKTNMKITVEPYGSVSYTDIEVTPDETKSTAEIKSSASTEDTTEIVSRIEIESYTDDEIVTELTDTTQMRTDIDFSSGIETSFVRVSTDAVVETTPVIDSSIRTCSEITEEPYSFVPLTALDITVSTTEETKSPTSMSLEASTATEIVSKTDMNTGAYTGAEIVTELTEATEIRNEFGFGTEFDTKSLNGNTDTVNETNLGIKITVGTTGESELPTEIILSRRMEASTGIDVSTEILSKTEIGARSYTDAEVFTGLNDATQLRAEMVFSTGLETCFVSDETYTVAGITLGIGSNNTTSTKITIEPYESVSFTDNRVTSCTTEETKSTSEIKSSSSIEIVSKTKIGAGSYTFAEIVAGLTDMTQIHPEIGSNTESGSFASVITNTVAETTLGTESSTRMGKTESTTETKASTSAETSTETNVSTETDVSTEMVFKTEIETEVYTHAQVNTEFTRATEIGTDVDSSSGIKTSFVRVITDPVAELTLRIDSSTGISSEMTEDKYGFVPHTTFDYTVGTTEETESTSIRLEARTATDVSTETVFKTDMKTGAYTGTEIVTELTETTEIGTGIGFGSEFNTRFMNDNTVIMYETNLGIEITVGTSEGSESSIESKSNTRMETSTEIDVSTEILSKTEIEAGSHTDTEIVTRLNDATELRSEIVSSTGFESSFVSDGSYTAAEITLGIGSNNETSTENTIEPYGSVSYTDSGLNLCTAEETESTAKIKYSTSRTDVIIGGVFKNETDGGSYTAKIVARLTDVTEMHSEIGSSTGFERSFMSSITHAVAETSTETITSTGTDVNTGTDIGTEMVFKTETEAHTDAEVITGFTHATETRTEVSSVNDSNMSSESTSLTSKPKYNESIGVVELEEIYALEETISVISEKMSISSTITSDIGSDRSFASSEISTGVSFTSKIITEASSATERQKIIAASDITPGTEIVSVTYSDIMKKTYSTRAETTTETESNTEVNPNITTEADTESDDGHEIETSTELKTDAQFDFRKVNEITNASDMSFGTESKSISGFSMSSEVTNVADMTTEFNIPRESIDVAENDSTESDGSTNFASEISTFISFTTSNTTGGISDLLTENQTETSDIISNINIRNNSLKKFYSQNITTISTSSDSNDITETENDTEIVSSFKTEAHDKNRTISKEALVPTEVYSTISVTVSDETKSVMGWNLFSTEVKGVNSNLDVGAHTETNVFEETELVTSTVAAPEIFDETRIGTTSDIATVTQVCTDLSCYEFEYSTPVPENETSTEKQSRFNNVFYTALRAKTDTATVFIPTQSSEGIETEIPETGTFIDTGITNKVNTNAEIANAINFSTDDSFIDDKTITISVTNGNRTESKNTSSATVSHDEISIITTDIVVHTVTADTNTTEYSEINSTTLIPPVYESGYDSSPKDSEKTEETGSASTLVSLPGDANATSTTETIIETDASYSAESRIILDAMFKMVTDSSELSSTEAMPYVISTTITTAETSIKSSASNEFTSATVVYNINDNISIERLPPTRTKFDENEYYGNYDDYGDLIN